jgi:iodotyrosine deiodinase
MDTLVAMRTRRSCRDFSARPVPRWVVDAAIDAARFAPRAGGVYGYHLVVLEGAAKQAFWEMTTDRAWREGRQGVGICRAPLVIVAGYDEGEYAKRYSMPDKAASPLARSPSHTWPAPFWITDTSFALMSVMLALHAMGVASLPFYIRHNVELVAERFLRPARSAAKPLLAVAVGYPRRASPPRHRLATPSELATFVEEAPAGALLPSTGDGSQPSL